MKNWLLPLFLFFLVPALAQDTLQPRMEFPGSTSDPHFETRTLTEDALRKRKIGMAIVNAAGFTGSYLLLNEAWYKDYPKTSFHTFNDGREWLQMDKVGHAWTTYNASRLASGMWKWAGIPSRKAAMIGSGSSFLFMTMIEYLDGRSEEWGWSWPDVAANAAGSSLYLLQESLWQDQRITVKFSARVMDYGVLNDRANDLFGKSTATRILKDYNAQTYWLSVNLRSFMRTKSLPAWLNLSVGYGAKGLFGGFANVGYDKNGAVIFSRPDIKRVRQWYISPDIDLSRIKTKHRTLRTALAILNMVKIPAPALEFSDGKWKGHWIAF